MNTKDLDDSGFVAVSISSEFGNTLAAAADEFVRYITLNVSNKTENPAMHQDTFGQTGFVEDGREGLDVIREMRSHLVVTRSAEKLTANSTLCPYFYESTSNIPDKLKELSAQIIELCESYTTEVFTDIRKIFGKDLRAQIADGERILRYHYFPQIPEGTIVRKQVEVSNNKVEFDSIQLHSSSLPVAWVTPHIDIGHWTWQLFATDENIVFKTKTGESKPYSSGTIVGNVGSYLATDVPQLLAPLHWVDSKSSLVSARVSIALFVHTHPASRLRNGKLSGFQLYEDLVRLGYTDQSTLECVERVLEKYRDSFPMEIA